MSKEQKEFLEEQLQWTKDQILILDEMDITLQEMKKIAEYAAENHLPISEKENLNKRLEVIKQEYDLLKAQRHTDFH